MNKITIYVANTKQEKSFVHALKIPKDSTESLCGIKSDKWESNELKVTCPQCLKKINSLIKKIEYIPLKGKIL